MNKLKKSITKRTALLISRGIKHVGLEDAFGYIYEDLYIDEAESVEKFIEWIKSNVHRASLEMRFVEENYPNLYKNYFLTNK